MEKIEKRIYVFAGPNGSGKSTVVKLFMDEGVCPQYYICPDQLVPPDKKSDVVEYLKAMEAAERLRLDAISNGLSFSFETVLSTQGKLDFIKFAQSEGYFVTVIYIMTSNPKINLERIKARVKHGGHDVPHEKVIARYEKCLTLMFDVIMASNLAIVYDNSADSPTVVLDKSEYGCFAYFGEGQQHDEWFNKYLLPKAIASGINIKPDAF